MPESATGESERISSIAVDESGKFLGGVYHPWRRYFAKILDLIVLGMAAYVAVLVVTGLVSSDVAAQLVTAMENQILAGIVVTGLWIPAEALLLATAGTTPARALFGITLRKRDGSRLNWTEALVRSFGVAIQGMGIGIPLVAFFTQFFAYRRLTRTGTTLWDSSANCEVKHVAWGPLRAVACVVVCLVVFGGLLALDAAES